MIAFFLFVLVGFLIAFGVLPETPFNVGFCVSFAFISCFQAFKESYDETVKARVMMKMRTGGLDDFKEWLSAELERAAENTTHDKSADEWSGAWSARFAEQEEKNDVWAEQRKKDRAELEEHKRKEAEKRSA